MRYKKLTGFLFILFRLTIQVNAQNGRVTVIQFNFEYGQPREKATVFLDSPGKKGNRKAKLSDRLLNSC